MEQRIENIIQTAEQIFKDEVIRSHDLSTLNMRIILEMHHNRADSLSQDSIHSLRTVVQESMCAAILNANSPDVFADLVDTYRALLIDSENRIIYPSSFNQDTFEAIASILCYFLVQSDLQSFEAVSAIIRDHDDAAFAKLRSECPSFAVIFTLYETLMTGSLEGSLRVIKQACSDTVNVVFKQLTGQFATSIREQVSSSIELSYKDLTIDQVLRFLHLEDMRALHEWIQVRERNRVNVKDAMAIPTEGELYALCKQNCTSILSERLKVDDLNISNTDATEDVVWDINEAAGTMTFRNAANSSQDSSQAVMKDLRRIRTLFAYGDYLEATL